jgi:hypothetical protein
MLGVRLVHAIETYDDNPTGRGASIKLGDLLGADDVCAVEIPNSRVGYGKSVLKRLSSTSVQSASQFRDEACLTMCSHYGAMNQLSVEADARAIGRALAAPSLRLPQGPVPV